MSTARGAARTTRPNHNDADGQTDAGCCCRPAVKLLTLRGDSTPLLDSTSSSSRSPLSPSINPSFCHTPGLFRRFFPPSTTRLPSRIRRFSNFLYAPILLGYTFTKFLHSSFLSFSVIVTLRAKLSGAVYFNRSCLWVCLCVGLLRR